MVAVRPLLAITALCVAAASCATTQPMPQPTRASVPAATVVPPAPTVPPQPAPSPAPPAEAADPCPALGPNEVSDDETPSVAGTTGSATAGQWLEARGVSRSAFRAWVRSYDPTHLTNFDADALFDGDGPCQTLVVGDAHEDALVCTLAVRTSIMRYSARAFVVRNRRIITVLEAGYALPAMDWPDMRWLDLALTFSADGLAASLDDRAEPGTFLVSPPSACHEYFARYLACERAHRDGSALEGVCPQMTAPSGEAYFGHLSPAPPPLPMAGERTVLRGCAEALSKLSELVTESGTGGPFAAEFRQDRAFAVKSCGARGRYVWKQGRFVRSP